MRSAVRFAPVGACLHLFLLAAPADAVNREYVGNEGVWHDENAWAPPGVPGSEDRVVIGPGTCRITSDAACGGMEVYGDLIVEAGQSLTLHGDSLIFGRVNLEGADAAPAILYIATDMTLGGELGWVEMWNGRIENTPGGRSTLTLAYVQRAPHVKPPLRLVGDGRIGVKLINHVWVAAEHEGKTLRLAGGAKRARTNGPSVPLWMASYGGTLELASPVSGDANFIIADGARMVVKAACEQLTGSVTLRDAVMVVKAPFQTTGALTTDGPSQLVSRRSGQTSFGLEGE